MGDSSLTCEKQRKTRKCVGDESKNTRIVKSFFDAVNEHDYKKISKIITSKCKIQFRINVQTSPAHDCHKIMNDSFQSLPDLHITADEPIEVTDGIVIASNAICTGTLARDLPQLGSMGCQCAISDVDEITFFVHKGKVTKILCHLGYYWRVHVSNKTEEV